MNTSQIKKIQADRARESLLLRIQAIADAVNPTVRQPRGFPDWKDLTRVANEMNATLDRTHETAERVAENLRGAREALSGVKEVESP